jgi:hypothetical protein
MPPETLAMNLSHFANFCEQAVKDGVLFYYKGEFSQNVIGAMTDTLKQRFVEMSQNIMHYADADVTHGAKTGALAVGKNGDSKYWVVAGNPVRIEHVERIKEKIEPLRSMTIDEIKAAYREQLRNDEQDTLSRGAGLGFLTVAREASEPLEYQIVFHSDQMEFAEFYLRASI